MRGGGVSGGVSGGFGGSGGSGGSGRPVFPSGFTGGRTHCHHVVPPRTFGSSGRWNPASQLASAAHGVIGTAPAPTAPLQVQARWRCLKRDDNNLLTSGSSNLYDPNELVGSSHVVARIPRRNRSTHGWRALAASTANPPSKTQESSSPTIRQPAGATPKGPTAPGGGFFYALDFDGVICDSEPETSASAWMACAKFWPDVFDNDAARERKEELMIKMARVRPVVETGYENMLLLRLLLEGTPVEDILDYWSVLLPETMKSWGLERGDMVDFFGAERTAWMEGQPDQWLDVNRVYEDVDKALAPVSGLPHCYVVTTKPQNLTIKLLKHKAMCSFPDDRVISTTVSGIPKSDILRELQQLPEAAGRTKVFVEDKLSTLLKVADVGEELDDWQLYLVEHGYVTKRDVEVAKRHPRIDVISKNEFIKLLKGEIPTPTATTTTAI
ncbi:hypothetical protein RI054_13g65780 [Pseudoscourfieldia marina]